MLPIAKLLLAKQLIDVRLVSQQPYQCHSLQLFIYRFISVIASAYTCSPILSPFAVLTCVVPAGSACSQPSVRNTLQLPWLFLSYALS